MYIETSYFIYTSLFYFFSYFRLLLSSTRIQNICDVVTNMPEAFNLSRTNFR